MFLRKTIRAIVFLCFVVCVPLFKTSGRRYEYSDMVYYPLYSFGYGLSYTNFQYSNLKTAINNDGSVTVHATVTNVGTRSGNEVAQLYITDMYASVKTRMMEWKKTLSITGKRFQ